MYRDECIENMVTEQFTKRESIYKSTLFKIGETLVDESKLHITSEKACEQIREYLKQQDVKLWQLKEVKE